MNKHIINRATLLIAVGAAASSTAFASHEASYSAEHSSYAKVVHSEPIRRSIEVSRPREECWQEPVHHRAERDYTTGRTILGGVIGAAIGHQIGSGRGNDAATVVGGLAGAAVGANSAKRARQDSYVSHETRCRTVYETYTEERIEGYHVTYRYDGQTYTTQMPHAPGKRIPVYVSVTPAQ